MNSKKTILVVDDTKEIRMLIKIRLEISGFNVIEAENGKDGVNAAKFEKPDLIITDYSMPLINGWEFAKILKTFPETKAIPIIMLSSFPFGRAMIDDFSKVGIDAYMMKPYEYERLFETIKTLLREKVSGFEAPAEKPASESGELRRSDRFTTFTHANIEIHGINYLSRIKNLSREGLSLVVPYSMDVGTMLTIKFIKGASDFVGKAKIVWIDKETEGDQFVAGIEMQSVSV